MNWWDRHADVSGRNFVGLKPWWQTPNTSLPPPSLCHHPLLCNATLQSWVRKIGRTKITPADLVHAIVNP